MALVIPHDIQESDRGHLKIIVKRIQSEMKKDYQRD